MFFLGPPSGEIWWYICSFQKQRNTEPKKYTWAYLRNTHEHIWEIQLARSVNVLSQTGWTLVYVLSQTPPGGGPLWLCAIDSTIYWDLAAARVPYHHQGTHPVHLHLPPIYSASSACGLALLLRSSFLRTGTGSIYWLSNHWAVPLRSPIHALSWKTPAAFTDLQSTNFKLPKLPPHLYNLSRIYRICCLDSCIDFTKYPWYSFMFAVDGGYWWWRKSPSIPLMVVPVR